MQRPHKGNIALALLLLTGMLAGCGDVPPSDRQGRRYDKPAAAKGLFTIPPSTGRPPPVYPWDWRWQTPTPITLYHLRCRGSALNPLLKAGTENLSDCGGASSHSLPLREDREFVYPCLLEILNYIQRRTGKSVIVTSGHRCPQHNSYIDNSAANRASKHQIGAAVDFYVEGFEQRPDAIVSLIEDYYKDTALAGSKSDYHPLRRWDKEATGVATTPWYNKEIFVKLFRSDEGRNLDNGHRHPYLQLQVRHDRQRDEKVTYSWQQAFHSFWRY